jgi:hypothetical protein
MKKSILTFLLASASAWHSNAAVIVTYAEDPSAYHSSLANTQVFDFNTVKTGVSTNVAWSGVGTFSQLFVKSVDAYGGASDATNPNGTRYSVQGAGTSVLTTTLDLTTDSSYFGMWWSAGDARNVLEFYNNNTLVSQFTTVSLLEPLPASYDGNPRNRLINSREPYAFINFFADEGTTWDRIVLRNNGSSGFESDNYTTRVAAWDPLIDGALPGVPVAIVEGTTSTAVTKTTLDGSRWSLDQTTAGAVPGAPAPPWTLLCAFGIAVAVRRLRQDRAVA